MNSYCKIYDAYYNDEKDEWLEKKCCTVRPETKHERMMTCWFSCWDRPEKPSMVKRDKNDNI